jgi:DNA-binding NarL/FixJ family response regulator
MATVEQDSSIRVAVIAADPVLRRSCIDLFDTTPDCRLVALVHSVGDAVLGLPPLDPDVVVMHVGRRGSADGGGAVDPALGSIAAPVVLFSTDGSSRRPADGVSCSAAELLDAVRSCGQRGVAARGHGGADGHPAGAVKLTLREREVGEMIVQAYSYKDIAKRLGVSVSTIGTHMHHIYEKLGVNSRRGVIEAFRRRAGTMAAFDRVSGPRQR